MKFKSKLLILTVMVAFVSTNLFAGSIDYLSNQSADYTRTFSRNASTDADSALYNPAGTAFMEKGFHVYGANQTVLKKYENDQQSGLPGNSAYDKTYKSTEPTLILPTGIAIYKSDKWAGYIAGNIIAGGGKAVYDNGLPTYSIYYYQIAAKSATLANGYLGMFTGDGAITSASYYPACTFGGSYSIADNISVSLSGRYVNAFKTYKGHATYQKAGRLELDAKESAQGVGAIIGFDIKPIAGLLVSAKYETRTKLVFETKINDGKDFSWAPAPYTRHDFFVDGEKRRKDLPALLAIGTSYTIDKLTATGSINYFFIKQSDQQKDDGTIYRDGYDDDYDNGYELALSVEYAVIPEFLRLSIGAMYTKVGGNKDTYGDFDFSLDSKSIGLGGRITAIKDLDIIFGLSRTFYKSSEGMYNSTTQKYMVNYKKSASVISFGAEYKI